MAISLFQAMCMLIAVRAGQLFALADHFRSTLCIVHDSCSAQYYWLHVIAEVKRHLMFSIVEQQEDHEHCAGCVAHIS